MTPKRLQGRLSWGVSACLILLVAAYMATGVIIRGKIASTMRALPPSVSVSYRGLHPLIFQSALIVQGLDIRIVSDKDTSQVEHLFIDRAELRGVSYFAWIFGNRLKAQKLLLDNCRFELHEIVLDGDFAWPEMHLPFVSASVREVHLQHLTLSVPESGRLLNYTQKELAFGAIRIPESKERTSGEGAGAALVYLIKKSEVQEKEQP